jgi:hypothetical protein
MERHAPGREAGQQIRKTPPRPNESMANACKSAANLLSVAGGSVQRGRRRSQLQIKPLPFLPRLRGKWITRVSARDEGGPTLCHGPHPGLRPDFPRERLGYLHICMCQIDSDRGRRIAFRRASRFAGCWLIRLARSGMCAQRSWPLGRFGDRRLDKGGRRCSVVWYVSGRPAFVGFRGDPGAMRCSTGGSSPISVSPGRS